MTETHQNIQHLRNSSFLSHASDNFVEALALSAISCQYPTGAKVFEKGDDGHSMYIVAHGSVRIHDGDIPLGYLKQGQVFGEIAALSAQQRTASITVESDALLVEIQRDDLYRCLTDDPVSAQAIIQALCDRGGAMAEDVRSHAVRVQLMEHELTIAKKIQGSFLPSRLDQPDGWQIDTHFSSAHEVAGDFYDVFHIRSVDRLAIVVGDVCGKGIGAALFMTLFRSLLRSTALADDFSAWGELERVTEFNQDAETLLQNCVAVSNNYVATTHDSSSMFAAIFMGLVDLRSGHMVYVNAGAEPPWLRTASGEVVKLARTGPVIGLLPNMTHKAAEIEFEPGATLLAFTDGLTEARNSSAQEFGEKRLLDAVTTSSASDILANSLAAARDFSTGCEQFDDITAITLTRLP